MMRLYLAGPMTSVPDFNFPLFLTVAERLRSQGLEIVNPAERDLASGMVVRATDGRYSLSGSWDRHEAMAWDLRAVLDSDGIVLLPGWEASVGARTEFNVATQAGKRRFVYDPDTHRLCPYNDPATVIGLAGYATSGKDSFGNVLVAEYSFVRVSFADALKDSACEITGMDREALEEAKGGDTEVRRLLQNLGLAMRAVDPMVWVSAAIRSMRGYRRVVVTDCRFNNERAALLSLGAKIVRVERPGVGPANDHVSETESESWDYDFVIKNSGTLDDLSWEAERLIEHVYNGGL